MQATYALMPDERIVELREEMLDPAALKPHDLLVEAEASVISAGTELAIFTAVAPGVRTPGSWNAYPWRPGYGVVGRVLASGSASDFAEGERIFCFGKHASHQIYDASGTSPFTAAFRIADDLPATRAVMVRMALVALTGPQLTTFEAGDSVAVFGLGAVGNLAAQLYRLAGARVIGLDPVKARCDAARRAGIDTVLDIPPDAQVDAVRTLTAGEGAAVTVDAVGHSAVVQTCIEACAPFGQVILLGTPRAPYQMNATDVFRAIHTRWLTVRGALEWRLPSSPTRGIKHSIESNLNLLLRYIAEGKLRVDVVTSHIIRPDQIGMAYHGLLNDCETFLGVVIDWQNRD